MSKLRQYDTLVIRDFEELIYHLPVHGHTYYELIYICSGSGIHILNDNNIPYQAGDLFMISPEDQHHFQIEVITRFVMIKFTDSYFRLQHQLPAGDAFAIVPEMIMRQKLLKEVKLSFEEPYKTLLRQAVDNIVLYDGLKRLSSSPYIYHQLLSIFGIVKEVMLGLDERIDNGAPNKETLISYIHENIYHPQLFRIRHVSAHFNISQKYFSDYFKRNFEIGYRDYINQYRLKLIEQRIGSGHVNMKQIALEFGFTDESHLSNYFKKHHSRRPSAFRKS